MKKEPKYTWDAKNGIAIYKIYYKNQVFVGTAECAPEDEDFKSERTGEHIAYLRAYIDYLKYCKNYEVSFTYDALKHLYGTMKHSKNFNEHSYEAKRLFAELEHAKEDLDALTELIRSNKEDLRLYIDEKDKFYKKQRAKEGNNE